MSYIIEMLPSARKAMAALPKTDRERVDARILSLADNPRPHGAIPLNGTARGLWRLRVGNYRVLYEIRDDRLIVVIVDVGDRREIYRGL